MRAFLLETTWEAEGGKMLNRFALGTRIFLGFSVVLILLAVVAYMGYYGVSAVSEGVEKAEDANRMAERVFLAREAENSFVLKKDEVSVQEVHKILGLLKRQAEETLEKSKEKGSLERITLIKGKIDAYEAAFGGYVDLENRKNEAMTEMEVRAVSAFQQIEAIRESLGGQLEAIRSSRSELIGEKLANAQDATRLMESSLEAEILRISLMELTNRSVFQEWKKLNESMRSLATGLKEKLRLEEDLDRVNRVLKMQQMYQEVFEKYINREDTDISTVDAVKRVMATAIRAVRDSQMEELVQAEAQAEVQMNDILNDFEAVNRIPGFFMDARKNEKELIITGDPRYREAVQEGKARILSTAAELKARFKRKENIERIDAVMGAVDAYGQAFHVLADFMDRQKSADHIMAESAQAVRKLCEETRNDQKKTMEDRMLQTNTVLFASAGAAMVFGILISFVMTRRIAGPLKGVIEGLQSSSEKVASASGQVSSASRDLAAGASEQAASIEETSSSLEEMSSMTRQNAQNAGQAHNLMREVAQVVGKADSAMEELIGSMTQMRDASRETSKIVKTIDEIAFQTNLLALNAAVEAARAGQAGAGFAVVADEVRSLALRTAEAARNTAGLIESTVTRIGVGADLVDKTSRAFSEVAAGAGRAGELVGGIAAASAEQAQGISALNTAVAEMDRVIQQNAATAEESAAASEELNAQAEQMKGFIRHLTILMEGIRNGGKSASVEENMQAAAVTEFPGPTRPARQRQALPCCTAFSRMRPPPGTGRPEPGRFPNIR
jgi:methyl-accepting chemotaxis protein